MPSSTPSTAQILSSNLGGARRNEFVVHWLWGNGVERGLRYRLLPDTQYVNVGVFRARSATAAGAAEAQGGVPVATATMAGVIALHAGWIQRESKVCRSCAADTLAATCLLCCWRPAAGVMSCPYKQTLPRGPYP